MMRQHVVVAIAIAALGVGACIIGPKQDDPASAKPTTENEDITGDATAGSVADTSTPADSGFFADAAPPAPVDASGDVRDAADASDGACADGGEPLTAIGPWNEAKMCWATTTQSFECVSGLDGGTVFTCFVRISTGERFLAPSTHIPSGADYRKCTDAENKSPYERCE